MIIVWYLGRTLSREQGMGVLLTLDQKLSAQRVRRDKLALYWEMNPQHTKMLQSWSLWIKHCLHKVLITNLRLLKNTFWGNLH